VIVGDIDHNSLLQTLQDQVESSILSKGQPDLANWKRYSRLSEFAESRPWVTSPQAPALETSHSKVVEFPEEDESIGELTISCFGPDVNVPLLKTRLISGSGDNDCS
jgi:hypothetical protein